MGHTLTIGIKNYSPPSTRIPVKFIVKFLFVKVFVKFNGKFIFLCVTFFLRKFTFALNLTNPKVLITYKQLERDIPIAPY